MNNTQKSLVGLVLAGASVLNGCKKEEIITQHKPNPIVYVTTAQKVEINPIYESSGNISKWKVSGVSVRKTEFEGSKYGVVQEKIYTANDPEFRFFREIISIEKER